MAQQATAQGVRARHAAPLPDRVSRMARAVLERVRQMEAVVAGGGTVAAREQLRGARAVATEVVYAVCGLYYRPDDDAVMAALTQLAAGQTAACSSVGQMVSHAEGDTRRGTRPKAPAWARGEAPEAGEQARFPQLRADIMTTLERCGALTFDGLHQELGGYDRCTTSSLQRALAALVQAGELVRTMRSAAKSALCWYEVVG